MLCNAGEIDFSPLYMAAIPQKLHALVHHMKKLATQVANLSANLDIQKSLQGNPRSVYQEQYPLR